MTSGPITSGPGRVDPESGLVLVRCMAEGFALLVDPQDADAILWHYQDGAHRLVRGQEADTIPADLHPDARHLRVDLLGLAVRLQDVADDMAPLLERMERLTVR